LDFLILKNKVYFLIDVLEEVFRATTPGPLMWSFLTWMSDVNVNTEKTLFLKMTRVFGKCGAGVRKVWGEIIFCHLSLWQTIANLRSSSAGAPLKCRVYRGISVGSGVDGWTINLDLVM
jgi:hypothetical protein